MNTPKIKTIGKLLIACSIFYVLFSRVDIAGIKELLPKLNLWMFFTSFLLLCVRNIVAAFRWQVLLQAKHYHVPLQRLTTLYFIGRFFSCFLPTAVGGDIARGYYVYSDGIGKQEIVSSIIVERILGLAAMMCLALVAMGFGLNIIHHKMIKIIVFVPCFVGLTALFVLYSIKDDIFSKLPTAITRKLRVFIDIVRHIHNYRTQPYALLSAFLLSVLFQVLGMCATYFISLSIGATVRFLYFLMLLPIVWLVSMLPVSINGLGLREGAFVFLFTSVGMAQEVAVTISVLFLAQSIMLGVSGGLFFLYDQRKIATIRTYSSIP